MPSAAALATVAPYSGWLQRSGEAVAEDLDGFYALLQRWQRVQNLVSRETLSAFWARHAADSLQLVKWLRPSDQRFLDMGSGGGLPGIPLAIARKGTASNLLLVEPTQRKASFLRTVARELDLSVEVRAARMEEIDSRETFGPDVITSRALAPLPVLCTLAARFFGPETHALFHKGREFVEELEETRALWHLDVLVHPSDTSADGAILEIRNLLSRTKS